MRTVAALFALVLPATAAAAPATLSYEQALDEALVRNLGLEAARLDVESAEGGVLSARQTFEPTLTADAGLNASTSETINEFGEVLSEYQAFSIGSGLSQYFQTGTNLSLDFDTANTRYSYDLLDLDVQFEEDAAYTASLAAQVTQNLLEGHRTSYNLSGVRAARQAYDTAQLTLESQRLQVLADTANAYWNLWYLRRQDEITQQSLAVAQEEDRIVKLRVDQGDLAPVERARVAAAVVQAQSAVVEARAAAASAEDALLVQLGYPPGTHVELTTRPEVRNDENIDPADAVADALARNPDLLVLTLTAEQAELTLADARHQRLPELTATGRYALRGFDQDRGGAVAEMFSGDLPEWYIGGSLSVPLANRAARGEVLSSQADLGRARSNLQEAELAMAQQVRAQVRTIETARQTIALAQANLALAEETLAAEQALQQAGRGIQKDVLEALANVDDARVTLSKARADHQLALVELSRLRGSL